MVSAVFHLNNKEAKHELKVNYRNKILPWCFEPKYLRETLDRSLTYRWHIESLRKKLTSRVALGAGATTLLIAVALVHSTAEYWAPAWGRSALTRLIDPAINDALRIAIGCLSPTPADNLPILAGIQPAELRRNAATLSLARRAIAMEPGHQLHSALTCPPGANARRLKSDTHLCSPHNNSSVYLTTTIYVRRTGRITNGRQSGWTTF